MEASRKVGVSDMEPIVDGRIVREKGSQAKAQLKRHIGVQETSRQELTDKVYEK